MATCPLFSSGGTARGSAPKPLRSSLALGRGVSSGAGRRVRTGRTGPGAQSEHRAPGALHPGGHGGLQMSGKQ